MTFNLRIFNRLCSLWSHERLDTTHVNRSLTRKISSPFKVSHNNGIVYQASKLY